MIDMVFIQALGKDKGKHSEESVAAAMETWLSFDCVLEN